MKVKDALMRYVGLPVAMGIVEYIADANLPSSLGVTEPMEEFAEGFLAAEIGVVVAVLGYRFICKVKNKQREEHEETGFAFLGGVMGMIAMTVLGLILHEVNGVTDNAWWPR